MNDLTAIRVYVKDSVMWSFDNEGLFVAKHLNLPIKVVKVSGRKAAKEFLRRLRTDTGGLITRTRGGWATMKELDLDEVFERITNRADFAEFVTALGKDLANNRDEWENPTLERYLEAVGVWASSMNHAYNNTGRDLPENPTWQMFAEILYAAKTQE